MFDILKSLNASKGLRACAAAVFCCGIAAASTAPYKSVVAIRELGLSDAAFSALTLCAAVINVIASIYLGTLADRDTGYRKLLMWLAAVGIAGYGAIFLFPHPAVFVLALLLPVSIFNGLVPMLFAAGRVFSEGLPAADRAAMSSALRGMVSAAWILVPGVLGFALAGRGSMLPAFLVAALAATAVLIVLKLTMPRGGSGDPARRPPKVSLLGAFGLLARPSVALRVLGTAAITSAIHVHAAVMPLIMTGRAGGTTGDVGIAVGIVAGMELVFLLAWARVTRYISTVTTLAIAMALYTGYLGTIAMASSPGMIIAGAFLGGTAASALITLPLGYLQELIADRPGLSASLISLNLFLAGAIAAGLFGLGTSIGSYATVAAMGIVVGLAGALGLVALERWRPIH
ncbi:MFS transporter [Alloyangia pacifica]|uniref:Predicted arabinose efflux permease, MFS family n=1 Tax=Alloyangia pacifica TaxID=311180 RepID=A0A1I6QRI1_9RHOB|nr:MFS transporter [Alloyangia pacifica]SDF96579.1 Predicted arabinose efflux permease, MFS family [Alloyangia pacifica]SFS55086.1 Predicted arabinose efflux permease, MFS family [Alloyangia pacifica]